MAIPLQKGKDANDRYVPYVSGGGALVNDGAGGGSSSGADPTASVGLSAVNGSAITFMRSDAAPPLDQGIAPTWTAVHIHNPAARTSGVAPYHRIVTPADTGVTADTEGIGIAFGGTSANPPVTVTRTLADGTTLALQREYLFTAPTYAAAGATTITDAVTLAISAAPIAGSNVTITNAFALNVASGRSSFSGGIEKPNTSGTGNSAFYIGADSVDGQAGIWMGDNASTVANRTTSNYIFLYDNGPKATIFNAPSGGSVGFRINNSSKLALNQFGALAHTAAARTGTQAYYFQVVTPADTNLTASTESIGVQIGGDTSAATVTRQFAGGALTTQREYLFVAPTYAATSASTITIAATVSIGGGPLAGSNVTITNRPSLLIESVNNAAEGGIRINGSSNSSQKIIEHYDNGGNMRVSLARLTFSVFESGYWQFINTFSGGGLRFGSGNVGSYVQLHSGGTVGFNMTADATPSAQVQIQQTSNGSASRISFQAESAASSTVEVARLILTANATNAVTNIATFAANSGGTAAAGFGQSFTFTLESSTTDNQTAYVQSVLWATATHASRKARVVHEVYDTAARECMRMEADGSNPMIGFYGANAVAKQTVTGSRGGNAALADLLTKLATLGLIVDSSS